MLTGKRVLITGGGGFIGTALAEALADSNEIVLMDSRFTDNVFAFSSLDRHPNVRRVEADILDSDAVESCVQGMQVVFHLAARLGVAKVVRHAAETLDVNYVGTSGLLKASSRSPELERFIFFSTSEVYGSSAFRVNENSPSVLSSVQDTRWCYSVSKLAGEQLAFAYYRERRLPVVVVRPFNVFGPRRIGDYAVLQFAVNALRGRPLSVFGDGAQVRAWCYVDDFCKGVVAAAESTTAIGEAFNIGNPLNTISAYRLARTVVALCQSASEIQFRNSEAAEVNVRVPDISKARKMLEFRPQVDLTEGLSRSIEWYRAHLEELH